MDYSTASMLLSVKFSYANRRERGKGGGRGLFNFGRNFQTKLELNQVRMDYSEYVHVNLQ